MPRVVSHPAASLGLVTVYDNLTTKNYNLKIKPIERLVPVSFTRYRASTPGLSTSWSVTALKGDLV